MKLLENKSGSDWAIFRLNSGKKWFATNYNKAMKAPDTYNSNVKYSDTSVLKFKHDDAIRIIQSIIGIQERYGIVNSSGLQKLFDWRIKYPKKYDDVAKSINETNVLNEGITAKGVEAYYKAVAKAEGVKPLPVKFGRVGYGGAAITFGTKTMKPLYISFDMNRMQDPEYAVLHELTHQIKLETEKDAYVGKRDQLAKFKKVENRLVEKYMYSKYSELIWKTKNEEVISTLRTAVREELQKLLKK